MKLGEFRIGKSFYLGGRKWVCTDIGTRTVSAICISNATIVRNGKPQTISESELKDWLAGPPYSLAEECLDEEDIVACLQRVPSRAALRHTSIARKRASRTTALA
jgi:hypothetical protein